MGNSDILATLNPVAAGTALSFLAAHPDAILTSGRRMVDAQCQAMADNIAPNHLDWVARTYKDTPVEEAVQAWITANPTLAVDVDSCETGLLGVLATFPIDVLAELSLHLTGDAFDVKPDKDASKIVTLKELAAARIADGGKATLLTEEGGLLRWHLQIA